MADSYVCSGATMKCTMGTSTARLTVLPIRTVFLTGQPMANISDHLTMVNLAPFGRCRSLGFPATAAATAAHHGHLTPMPCMHNTPFPWMNGKNDYIVKGDPALLKSSTCQCMWGGTISLVTDGQTPSGAADLSKRPKEPIKKENNTISSPKRKIQSDQNSANNNIPAKGFTEIIQDINDLMKILFKVGTVLSPPLLLLSVIQRKDIDIQRKEYKEAILRNNIKYEMEQPDKELMNTLKSWLNKANIVELLKKMTVEQRKFYIQRAIRPKFNQIMGLDLPLYSFFYEEKGNLGTFNDRSLNINSYYLESSDEKEITILLNTIIHENKHARQYYAFKRKKDYGYSKELLNSWKKNWQIYINPPSDLKDIQSLDAYYTQPTELDAYCFSLQVIDDGTFNPAKCN